MSALVKISSLSIVVKHQDVLLCLSLSLPLAASLQLTTIKFFNSFFKSAVDVLSGKFVFRYCHVKITVFFPHTHHLLSVIQGTHIY